MPRGFPSRERQGMQTANEKAPFSRSFFIEFRYHFESDKVEVPPGFGPGNKGFADLRLTAWLWHRSVER